VLDARKSWALSAHYNSIKVYLIENNRNPCKHACSEALWKFKIITAVQVISLIDTNNFGCDTIHKMI